MNLSAFARGAEVVWAEFSFAAVTTEDEMDVALAVDDERGAAMVVEFTGINLVRGFTHGIHPSMEGADPFPCGVIIGRYVGIFVRAGIGDVGHALVVLGGRMLECADGVAVSVVGKMLDVGGI